MWGLVRDWWCSLAMPVFSVVIPVYNVEPWLPRCVESVLGQGFSDFEVVLVDDGSSDGSPALCEGYASTDARVKVVHKSNGGLCSARNAGLAIAAGDYIVPVDSDDWMVEDALETLWSRAIEPYKPDAVIFNATMVYPDREEPVPCYAASGFYDSARLRGEILPYMIWDKRLPFCRGIFNPMACNKVYRREILLKHHCEDERIRMGEDNAYVFEALYHSTSLVVLEDALYCYFKGNESSISTAYDPTRFENNRLLIDYLVSRLGGKEEWLDDQLNAFKAYWLFIAIFHEARANRGFVSSCRHLKEGIEKTNATGGIDIERLPRSARVFLALIRSRCYPAILAAAKAGSTLKDRR